MGIKGDGRGAANLFLQELRSDNPPPKNSTFQHFSDCSACDTVSLRFCKILKRSSIDLILNVFDVT